MKCQKTNCDAEATQRPVMNIPAKGHPAKVENCIHVQIGLSLCLECTREIKPQEFVGKGKQMRKMVEVGTRGKATPDFKRAFITSEGLDTEESNRFSL